MNSGVHAHTHEYLATAREDQKFGIAVADAPAAVADIRARESLEFLGLHSHIGSQIFETAGFDEAARRLLELHARLLVDGRCQSSTSAAASASPTPTSTSHSGSTTSPAA